MIRVLALSLLLASCTVYSTTVRAEFLGVHGGIIFGMKWEEDADGISRHNGDNDAVHPWYDMSTNSMLYGKWDFDSFELDAGISHLSDTFHPDDEYYKNQAFIKLQKCMWFCKK